MINIDKLKSFFPEYNGDQVKNQIELFEGIYNKIKNKYKKDIDDIINYNTSIVNDLEKNFPGYSLLLINAFIDVIENRSNSDILSDKIDDLMKQESSFTLIKLNLLESEGILKEFLKTAKSIGVLDKNIHSSSDLENRYEDIVKNPSSYNYSENYKDWVGKKILLTNSEIKKLSVLELDSKMMPYLELALNHIKIVLSNINSKNVNSLKSIFFDEIHNQGGEINLFGLLKKYYSLEQDKREILSDIKKGEKNIDDYSSHLNQIEMGKYEIQRLFALSVAYINRENTLTYQNANEEQDFLVSKLKDIGTDEMKNRYLDTKVKSNDLLYNYTKKKDLYWKKENGGYVFSDILKEGYNKSTLDSFDLEGKLRNYDKHKQIIKVIHIGTRTRKNAFSSVEKLLRKGLSSYNEILDHKGFIFVVNNYDEDGDKLKHIIENEFGTLRTSWIEEPMSMKKAGNSNTNGDYDSMKGILKVSYKGKLIKDFFNLLEKILDEKNNKELINEFTNIYNI